MRLNNVKKTRRILALVVLSTMVSAISCIAEQSSESSAVFLGGKRQDSARFLGDESTRKIWQRNRIEKEARQLVDEGRYEEAISKFREATNPSLLNYDYEASTARGLIRHLLVLTGDFDQALKELQYVTDRNPAGTGWIDEKLELEALIKSRDTNSPEPIYDHIRYLREKYKDQLPPTGYTGYSIFLITTIIRLYDHIGNYEGGIAFIDDLIVYYSKQKHGFDPEKRRYDADLMKVREAFEQDKAEGRKSCVSAKPGEVCMGRATKALIQSDYFPW